MSLLCKSMNQSGQIVRRADAGQIIVEYVLLLVVAVSIALVIVTRLVKRDSEDPENSGALIKKWQNIQQGVAEDVPN